jgi:hypothetical protein
MNRPIPDLDLFARITRSVSFFEEELLTDRSGLIPAQRAADGRADANAPTGPVGAGQPVATGAAPGRREP